MTRVLSSGRAFGPALSFFPHGGCRRACPAGGETRPAGTPSRGKQFWGGGFTVKLACRVSEAGRYQGEKNMNKKPVHQVKMGAVRGAVWANETKNGTFHSVTFSRVYKNGEEWKDSQSFHAQHLPLLIK